MTGPALTGQRAQRLARARSLVAAALVAAGAWLPAHAGPYTVQPTRLHLGSARPSGALTVRNEGTSPVAFRIQAMRWTQDDEGRDHYADTTDLIYFPRLLTVTPGQGAVIRLGLRQSTGPLEHAYRLFIEELAPADGAEGESAARIRVLVRFGAPVFVEPLLPRHQLTVPAFHLERGQARWTLRNEGSQHEVFEAIDLRGLDEAGTEVFRQGFSGRYFLAGSARHFQAVVPADICRRVRRLVLEVKTDHSRVARQVEAGPSACLPDLTPSDA